MNTQEPNPSADKQMRRQFVKFSFYKLDPSWLRLDEETREATKQDFCRLVESIGSKLFVKSFSLVGMRGDADLLLWQIAERLEDLRDLASAIFCSDLGPYISTPYSYLAMTRRSIYVTPEDSSPAGRLILKPTTAKYMFVYPFVKTRAWYQLTKEARQAMMDEHITIGRKYPSVKLNTTYSFGLDDQEFVVAFETDEPGDFLDLVMELRETQASVYTERDTPIFTCIAMPLREALDSLSRSPERREALAPKEDEGNDTWTRVAELEELAPRARKLVYYRGEQVALFNIEGRIYAVTNRCPHANGPLVDGETEGIEVICPWHGSRFALTSGEPLNGPATKGLTTYRVKVQDGAIYLASAERPLQYAPETAVNALGDA